MGKPNGESQMDLGNGAAKGNEDQVSLSQRVQAETVKDKQDAVPSSALGRMVKVTEDGIKEIPQGFYNSFDYHNILPNLTAGFVIGGASRLLLPEGGPVATVAGLAMGAYFLGKPIVNTYGAAIDAKTPEDMHKAAVMFGDTVGGLPVTLVEAGVGAKLGSGLVGRVLATEAAAPLTQWKTEQYAKLDNSVNSGVTNIRNYAFDKFGIGSPIAEAHQGIVPPYVLEELARRNPDNPDFLDTIKKTRELSVTGRMSARASQDMQGFREVYDAQGEEVQPGVKARFENEKPTGNAEVDNAFDYTGEIRSYYKDVHGRNSIDGKGMKLVSTVNYGDNYENAFWNGSQMTYGKPGASSPFRTFVLRNVAGHEITHGVTEFESGLVYRNQPGALNEHLSDVFGALIEQKALGQTADQASWLVGDGIWKPGIKGRALRDMMNPGTAYDDAMLGKDPQPAHMKDFVKTSRDNGGVHLNSGIPNRAFALFSTEVGGNAWEGPGKIWYQAREMAGSSPSFAQFAYQTIEAAKQLGHSDLVPKLEKAWSDVGVVPSAKATETTTPSIPLITNNPDKNNAA